MELKQLAIHEAGHAVVGYTLGLACNNLTLTHEGEGDSFIHTAYPNTVCDYEGKSLHERNTNLRAEAIASCAGLAAEHVFFNVPLNIDNENAQSDFQNIIKCERNGLRISGNRGGFTSDDETLSYIPRGLVEAKRLVKRHRKTIRLLADILVEKKKLSAEEVERLLKEQMPQ